MTFDPETMTWVGNETATDIFDQIDDLEPHRSFNVEDEFVMSAELIKSFVHMASSGEIFTTARVVLLVSALLVALGSGTNYVRRGL